MRRSTYLFYGIAESRFSRCEYLKTKLGVAQKCARDRLDAVHAVQKPFPFRAVAGRMDATAELPSPWWYRQRGTVFGLIYGLGFFLGYLSFDGHAHEPVAVTWGSQIAGGNGTAILLWCGVASGIVAWLLRASGTAYLKRDVVFASDVQSDKLIVAGPFRYVRNPLYLGNLFLAFTVAVLAPPLGFAIILIGNVVLGAALAAEESRQMARRYGAVYEAFRSAVPSFVPRLTPAHVPGSVSVEPAWIPALLGEAFCLAMALALIPIIVLGDAGVPAFWAIYVVTFVVFGAWGWWSGRTRKPRETLRSNRVD